MTIYNISHTIQRDASCVKATAGVTSGVDDVVATANDDTKSKATGKTGAHRYVTHKWKYF